MILSNPGSLHRGGFGVLLSRPEALRGDDRFAGRTAKKPEVRQPSAGGHKSREVSGEWWAL